MSVGDQPPLTIDALQRAIDEIWAPPRKRVMIVSTADYPYMEAQAEQLLADANIVEIRANRFLMPGTAYVMLHPDELTLLSPMPIQPRLRISIDDDDIRLTTN